MWVVTGDCLVLSLKDSFVKTYVEMDISLLYTFYAIWQRCDGWEDILLLHAENHTSCLNQCEVCDGVHLHTLLCKLVIQQAINTRRRIRISSWSYRWYKETCESRW